MFKLSKSMLKLRPTEWLDCPRLGRHLAALVELEFVFLVVQDLRLQSATEALIWCQLLDVVVIYGALFS